MAEELQTDICVIGGGPGGIAVAVAAAEANIPVVLVEKGEPGGANLAMAVPAKALVAAASRYEALRTGPAFGVTGAPLQVNLNKVHDHIRAVMDSVAATVSAERLTALGALVIRGEARFTDRLTVVAGDTAIRARHFVIATGSRLVPPDLPGLGDIEFMTLGTLFDAARRMTHLIVLGAGRRGLEIAQAWNRLGVDATVIDEEPALADDDPELAALVTGRLRAEGIRVRDRAKIVGFARRRGGIRVTLASDGGEEVAVDGTHLLVATGSVPNTEALGLDAAGIAFGAAGITVDRRLRTTNRSVHAIGDVIAGPTATARAEHQGNLVFRAIHRGKSAYADDWPVPLLASTDPALARVGLDEAAAREVHRDVRVLRLPFFESDLAQAERATAGMVKVTATAKGRILGAAAVGREAGEIVALFSLAIASRLSISALQEFVPPYPSRADLARRVALSFEGPGMPHSAPRRIIELLRKTG